MTVVATATVKGGLFHQYGNTLVGIGATGSNRRIAAQKLAHHGTFAIRQIARTLDGVAAGSTATKQIKRIEANSELGGKRTIETETLVNRATVAGDITNINHDILARSANTYTSSPVANKDGNPLGTR